MKKFFFIFFLAVNLGLFSPGAKAQNDGQIQLTITPPMIRNNVNPGQILRSSIKLVNNNSKEIDIYVRLNDFKGGKEDGTVEFLPELTEGAEAGELFLSQWIEIEKGPIKVEPYKSVEIPFSIRVPENAEPGGHYAAILAGTQPDKKTVEGSAMKVSSLLASLILLNVQGDVEEIGMVREFSTSHKYYGKEEVDFTVRFQNSGNVHIQPQGEIRIYNMWGKDKGAIAINQGSAFGNVLPGDVRKWNFSWTHDNNLLEMGRHKAVLILGYGNQARRTVDQTMYFWIIFVKPLLLIMGALVLFIAFVVVSIRLYIKRAIARTQKEAGMIAPLNQASGQPYKVIPSGATVVNLRAEPVLPAKASKKERVRWAFLRNYSRSIIIVLLIVLGGISYVYYQRNYGRISKPESAQSIQETARQEETRPAALSVGTKDRNIAEIGTASSTLKEDSEEEVKLSADEAPEEPAEPAIDNEAFSLRIANGSGLIGAASDVDKALYAAGYKADQLGNADNFNYQITLVKYLGGHEKAAQEISRLIGVKVEMQEVEKQDEDILVIVGKNIK